MKGGQKESWSLFIRNWREKRPVGSVLLVSLLGVLVCRGGCDQ